MIAIITCKYEEDLIIKWKKKVGDIVLLFCSRAHKLWVTGPILTEFDYIMNLIRALCVSSLSASKHSRASNSGTF